MALWGRLLSEPCVIVRYWILRQYCPQSHVCIYCRRITGRLMWFLRRVGIAIHKCLLFQHGGRWNALIRKPNSSYYIVCKQEALLLVLLVVSIDASSPCHFDSVLGFFISHLDLTDLFSFWIFWQCWLYSGAFNSLSISHTYTPTMRSWGVCSLCSVLLVHLSVCTDTPSPQNHHH